MRKHDFRKLIQVHTSIYHSCIRVICIFFSLQIASL